MNVKHTLEMLAVGTEIYYTGDMANQAGFGKVVNHRLSARWGDSVDLLMDDGREMKGMMPVMFDKSIGRRFMLASEYRAERAAKIEAMKRDIKRVTNR